MIRVVIADDHQLVRLGLRSLLAGASDIELVGEADGGEAALRLCADLTPDVVVLDLSMEGVDGLETMRRLKQRAVVPKILALTMHEEESYLIPALEAGANGYIVKAAASTALLDAIRTVARGDSWVSPTAAPVLAQGWARRAAHQELRSRYDTLSERERQVFLRVARGHSATHIGEQLHVSPKTVDTYRRRVNEKLGTDDRSDYVQIALKLGLLSTDP